MLKVGLTGGLGSGKSTVAALLHQCGAHVIEADAVGRSLMQPGQPTFDSIVQHFGPSIVREDGTLDRRALAVLAFEQGRVRELSLLVHPAVIAAQEQWMHSLFAREPQAVAVIESALIFEAGRDGTVPGWRERFDLILLVTAPLQVRIERFIARAVAGAGNDKDIAALRADAEARIAAQIPDEEKIPLCDIVLQNNGSLVDMRAAVQPIWAHLSSRARTLVNERDVP